MKICLDDQKCRDLLRPFTDTRHVADIRIGILTIKEKWALLSGEEVLTTTAEVPSGYLVIEANIIPTTENVNQLIQDAVQHKKSLATEEIKFLHYPWHIFQNNDWAIRKDFKLLTGNRHTKTISESNRLINKDQVFIEEGAQVEFCIINASEGPVYIGKNALIMEGSMIRGPFAAGEGSILKMGSRIYGGTTIGPHCVAGGEIKNAVLFEYSNKAHDGYLGDSVIGAWCNLGAGTSNSNIKNTGADVKYQLDESGTLYSSGFKSGLLMGDYSRTAINTSFNTGSVAGVCCNIFGASMPGKYIPNFTWGLHRYELEKALKDIDNWKKMKHQHITATEISLLTRLYHSAKPTL